MSQRLTSPSKVRAYALESAAREGVFRFRYHLFTGVSKSFVDAVERNARAFVEDRVRRHQLRGITFK